MDNKKSCFFSKEAIPAVIYYIVGMVSILFIISLFKKEAPTIETINSWVSIILGSVATILSIMSMWLSFYSHEKAREEASKSTENISNFRTDMIKELKEMHQKQEERMNRVTSEIKDVKNEVGGLKEIVRSDRPGRVNEETSSTSFDS